MPTINLLNQSAPTKSTDQNAAALINMYMVEDQDQGKYNVVAYFTPGLTVFASGLAGNLRAEFEEHGITYAVAGNTFYSIASNGTATSLGTLNTSSGFAKIRGINGQLLIIDGTNGYYYKITANTFGTIASSSSGNIVSSVTMTAVGSNYSSSATCTISGGGGSGATGTPIITNGEILGVTITSPGANFTSAPGISFSDSTGSGATAEVTIAPSGFPANAIDIECQDEFGLALLPNSQQWVASAISDLTNWPVLQFASVTGDQNNLVAIAKLHREIFLFQETTTEVWDNLGLNNFTFGRNNSVYIECGCAAKQSVAKGNNTLFFLAQFPSGSYAVCMFQNYTPVKISTRGIDYQISTYSTVSDAIGFCYAQEGHEFYVLTFPTAGVTWVYDMTTGLWHQRQSLVSNVQTRWLPSCYTYCYGKQLVGDYQSSNIYQLDMTNFTENGTAITRTIVSHPFYLAGNWIYLDRLQIDTDTTPASTLSQINLFVSRDGGNTYGSAKAASPQSTGYGYRTYWVRLGQARSFVLKIQTSMNAKFIVLGAWANIRSG